MRKLTITVWMSALTALLLVNSGSWAATDTRELPESDQKRIEAAGGDQTKPEKIKYLSPDTVSLTKKESEALKLGQEWMKGGPNPFLVDGRLTYVHGSGVTTIIAQPFQVSDVELESGEIVNTIVVGDSSRWQIESGSAGNTVHLFVKFVKPLDVGLESSAVVTTDRRVYHLRLISKQQEYTPYVGFVYVSDLPQQLVEIYKANKFLFWLVAVAAICFLVMVGGFFWELINQGEKQ